jgi:hypothetical protein
MVTLYLIVEKSRCFRVEIVLNLCSINFTKQDESIFKKEMTGLKKIYLRGLELFGT